MRPVRALVIFVAVVFVGGGLPASWLYGLAQSFLHVFLSLERIPFYRFVRRAFFGLSLLLMFLCRRFRNTGWRSCYGGIFY